MDNTGNDQNISYSPQPEEELVSEGAEIQNTAQHQAEPQNPVVWTGSEFIEKHKNASWYGVYFIGLLVVLALIFLFTRDYISTVAVALVGIIFAVLANHKPRQLSYSVDNKGINIGTKFYPFEQFKSFALSQDGAIGYINLLPLKRFMPEVSIFFPPDRGEEIVNILAGHLPHDHREEKSIDRLAKRFHF